MCALLLYGLGAPYTFAKPVSGPQQDQGNSPRYISAKGQKLIKDLAALYFERLGHPAVRWDAIPPVKASSQKPHQLLVALVRFQDVPFTRFAKEEQPEQKLQSYYQELLFDPTYQRANTLSHYFAQQSYRQYHLQGQVLAPIVLEHDRAYYGRPKRPEGGSWRNDTDAEGLVEEVLSKIYMANPNLDWAKFDQWDPNDVDQDGVYEEADGYLDHLVIVYAGGGQSSCQGLYKLQQKLNPNVGSEVFKTLTAQELECADRIWPHRFKIQRREGQGPFVQGRQLTLGGAPIHNDLWARDYNMQSEYTEISTFIHEFGHSIGLPDVYARQTNNSTGPWELMSSTRSPSPQGLSAWSRIMLGWLRPTIILPPEAGGMKEVESPLVTIDTPASQYEQLLAPMVAQSKKELYAFKKKVVQPLQEDQRVKSLLEQTKSLALGLKKKAEDSDILKEAQKTAKKAYDEVKQTVKTQLNQNPELKNNLRTGQKLASEGLEKLEEGLIETKRNLEQLAPTRALLIPLPPQIQHIDLIDLQKTHGHWALYSGQGNELNRKVTLKLDLKTWPQDTEISLDMDAWWEIEAGWDFAYMEIKKDEPNAQWQRLVDPLKMTAKHGHDGKMSLPGFTGRSGDLDGDGKNESAKGCDPQAKIAYGEEKVAQHPCEQSTWSHARFNLSAYAGQKVLVRLRYFTDPAAVERGILIDNLQVSAKPTNSTKEQLIFREDFEEKLSPQLSLDGFLKSSGIHEFEIPHFYIVEHRDPYAGSSDPKSKEFRYDSALGQANPIFAYNIEKEEMQVLRIKARPGALIWYVNGKYAWSENEPTQNGPGNGFLLAVDSNPNEFLLPGLKRFYKGQVDQFNTHYDFGLQSISKKGEDLTPQKKAEQEKLEQDKAEAQELLKRATLQTICFVRTSWSYPRDLPKDLFYTCPGSQLPQLSIDGKTPKFVYEVINRLLPGTERASLIKAGEFFDFKIHKGKTTWRLRDRSLRTYHLFDAPFSSKVFNEGIEVYRIKKQGLELIQQIPHPARASFSDQDKWQNPYLRFGGVNIRKYGLSIEFNDQKAGTNVKVKWE